MHNDHVTTERLTKYFSITGEAINKIKIAKPLNIDWNNAALDFLDMAKRYFSDAQHFQKRGKIVDAFACLNYAHGWLDAGARLGLFDVGGDNRLFTVDKEHVRGLERN